MAAIPVSSAAFSAAIPTWLGLRPGTPWAHPDERDARALLQGRGQQHYLSDRGLCQVGDLQLVDDRFDQLSTEYAILHVFRFRFLQMFPHDVLGGFSAACQRF